MNDSTQSIGPGALGGTKDQPFLLSAAEWQSIQLFVKDALALPTTNALMRSQLAMPASESIDPFVPIVTAYKTIYDHCTDWQNKIWPNTVNLADNIVHYNTNVPVYYGALNELLPPFGEPMSAQNKAQFKAVVDLLSKQAATFADNAENVEKAITAFSKETAQDKETITTLIVKYNKEYGENSTQVKNLRKDMEAQTLILISANKSYSHDVVVAATTATYAWVPIWGWIAGPIVAGVYGHRAVEALHHAHEASAKIKEYGGEIQRDTVLMHTITKAELGLNSILTELNSALAIIQKIKGIWSAIASDLTNIGTTIETDIVQALTIIKNFGIDSAIADWASVANEANNYRVNAYISPQTTAYCVAHKAEFQAMLDKVNAATEKK